MAFEKYWEEKKAYDESNKVEMVKIVPANSPVFNKSILCIFDRFYTTDQSRTKKTTGLGLAIVKRFAVQMGGDAKAYLENERFMIEVSFPFLCKI